MKTLSVEILQQTIGQLVGTDLHLLKVFQKYNIDFCCGAGETLSQACAIHGISESTILLEVEEADREALRAEDLNWLTAALRQLVKHITQTHHARVREQLPGLIAQIGGLAKHYGKSVPELNLLRGKFYNYAAELEMHQINEERFLFPVCRKPAVLFFEKAGGVSALLSTLQDEDQGALQFFDEIQDMALHVALPVAARKYYGYWLQGMFRLEEDMERHVREEIQIPHPLLAAVFKIQMPGVSLKVRQLAEASSPVNNFGEPDDDELLRMVVAKSWPGRRKVEQLKPAAADGGGVRNCLRYIFRRRNHSDCAQSGN